MRKILILLIILILGLYPIVELTRVIIINGSLFPDLKEQFIWEVIIMWILYLLIIPIFLLTGGKNGH